jgi:hypothetical protein
MESRSADIPTRVARLEQSLRSGWNREIHLQAEVYAHREFLIDLAKRSPPPHLAAEQIADSLALLIQKHRQDILLQVERNDPALAAWLAQEDPPFV